jgi:hypothetical protein
MNKSNLIHAGYSLVIMLLFWALTGNALASALLIVGFFAGREHSQAEYRAISTDFGNRASMPWYSGFNPKYWGVDSVLDLALPIAAVSIVLFIS